MSWHKAILEWRKTCDSGKCTAEHRQIFHETAQKWVFPHFKDYFTNEGIHDKDWGARAWHETEYSFSGKLQEKHVLFHRATQPTVTNPSGFIFRYLKERFVKYGPFATEVKKERKLNRSLDRVSQGTSPVDGDRDADSLWAILTKKRENKTDDPEGCWEEELLNRDAVEVFRKPDVIAKITEDMEPWMWSLLLIKSLDLKIYDAGITDEIAQVGDLPGKTQRYVKDREMQQWIHQRIREQLATPFIPKEKVDPLDVLSAARYLISELFRMADTKVPENFRQQVSMLVETD
jgi:hypothetical protein